MGAFHKLLIFLLGADRVGPRPLSPISTPENIQKAAPAGQKLAIPLPAPSPTSTLQRRWSTAQVKDFTDLHATMATLILSCRLQTTESTNNLSNDRMPINTLPPEVHIALYGQSAPFYLQVCL